MEKLIIERKLRFGESKYSVGIYINGEFVVNTIEANRQEIPLAPGKYLLEVRQGNRSGKTEIEIHKNMQLSVSFSGTTLVYMIAALFIAGLSLAFFTGSEEAGFLFYIPAFVLTLYTYTTGRKNYFVFEEPVEEPAWLAKLSDHGS